jgi:hypothetical protein
MGRIDPLAALARQQKLAAAARLAVDACLPRLTSVDATLPPASACKTNPIPSLAPRGAQMSPRRAEVRTWPIAAPAPREGVDRCLPPLTSIHPRLPNSPPYKTNPISRERPAADVGSLSPQRLAAARLLARGRRVAEVAAELRVTRQVLWKWRRDPAFRVELARLHELIARQPREGR